jgi:GRAS domain family
MLDCNLPRDNPERLIIERHFLMAAAINAIAFEGPDRVERPETYRQWHARKLRAGLVPLPAGSMIKNNLKEFV